MQFMKTNFLGDPNIGLRGFATDSYALLGVEPRKLEKIKEVLGVDVKVSSVAGTEFVGIFAAGNKNGIILPKIIEDYELERIKKMFDINVEVIESRQTALGNLVLCNDHGCLIAKCLEKFKKQIEDCLGVEVHVATIANYEIIGSAARANNKGCVVHNDADKTELKKIEKILKVKADLGTINFGTPFIKAGIIVNSKGLVASEISTGPELDRAMAVFI